ncbi:MAG TPA: alpha/beta hydrolase [Candidatus Limnocylindrales bacterium]|nr:alpha/beta hydrolase [Candidatus Limnocylindrales bacterium]
MVAPFPDRPSRLVASTDGTRIAVFSAPPADTDAGAAARLPLLLVHGTTADHRTWRVVGPELARRWPVHAMDRRGRGDSGDVRDAYSIERELEDVAAVAEALAAGARVDAVDVVGHSLGGRIALGASLRTTAIRRVVAYESAPTTPARPPGSRDVLLDALRADLARGDNEALLERFMREAVGMPEPDLAAFRADPVWPRRAAAAPTIVRELEAAETAPAISLEALARVTVPVLQLAGSAGPAVFRDGAAALDARLAAGRLVIIEGARHAAHHSHPAAFVAEIELFLRG